MTLFLPLLAVLLVTAAVLSFAMDIASAVARRDAERANPSRRQLPADDLIGKELRDVR